MLCAALGRELCAVGWLLDAALKYSEALAS